MRAAIAEALRAERGYVTTGALHAVIFLASAALGASVCGHRVMEWLAASRLLSSDYADYDHVAVAPVGTLALAAAVAGIVHVLSYARAAGRASGIAVAGRAVLRVALLPSVVFVLALQLAALNLCENIEHLTAFGRLCDGAEWLGGPPVTAVFVHGLIACAFTLVLRRSLGAVLQTCDALLRAVAAFVFALSPVRESTVFCRRRIMASFALAACGAACENGLRAPPVL